MRAAFAVFGSGVNDSCVALVCISSGLLRLSFVLCRGAFVVFLASSGGFWARCWRWRRLQPGCITMVVAVMSLHEWPFAPHPVVAKVTF